MGLLFFYIKVARCLACILTFSLSLNVKQNYLHTGILEVLTGFFF